MGVCWGGWEGSLGGVVISVSIDIAYVLIVKHDKITKQFVPWKWSKIVVTWDVNN